MKKIIKKIKRKYINTVESKPGAIVTIAIKMTIALIIIIEIIALFTFESIVIISAAIPLIINKNKEKIERIFGFWKYYFIIFKVKHLVKVLKSIFVLLIVYWLFSETNTDASIKNYFTNALNVIFIILQTTIGLLVFGASYKGFYNIRSRLILGKLEFSDDEQEYFTKVLNKSLDKYGGLKIKENSLMIGALIRWNYGSAESFEEYKIPNKTEIAEEKFYKITPMQSSKYTSYILSGNEKYRAEVEDLLKEEPIYKFSMKKDEDGEIIICKWSDRDEKCN